MIRKQIIATSGIDCQNQQLSLKILTEYAETLRSRSTATRMGINNVCQKLDPHTRSGILFCHGLLDCHTGQTNFEQDNGQTLGCDIGRSLEVLHFHKKSYWLDCEKNDFLRTDCLHIYRT